MRQVHCAPIRIAEGDVCRPAARAGLGQVLSDAPFVAEVKPPPKVKQEPLSRAALLGREHADSDQSSQNGDEHGDEPASLSCGQSLGVMQLPGNDTVTTSSSTLSRA